jgi:uncharacterized protein (TIGR02271 family)
MTIDRSLSQADEDVIPVLEEEAVLGKRVVETGRVRIDKTVESKDYTVTDDLRFEEAVIERVTHGTPVDPNNLPQVRHEGGMTIIPVFEEVLVVEKRLVLKEELHVQRVTHQTRHTVPVTLKREHVTVERNQSNVESEGSDSPR